MQTVSSRDMTSDSQLITRAQNGEPGGFDQLVQRYRGRIYRAVSRIIPDPASAEDVVQESFLKAYRSLGKFRGDSAFYSWLYRIAVNTAKNDRIQVGRRPAAVDLEETPMDQLDASGAMMEQANPEALCRSSELADRLADRVADLQPEYREALLLREIHGLTYEAIARIVGCPIGTVRSRIFRARMAIEAVKEPA
jgi:RNA polymerase sigma-70 factor (ECF subfamily)